MIEKSVYRLCTGQDCKTVLSIYNNTNLCSLCNYKKLLSEASDYSTEIYFQGVSDDLKTDSFNGMGERIKKLRENKKLTRREVNQDLGFHSNFMSLAEMDKVKNVSAEQLYRLAKYFDVSMEYLYKGE